MSDQHMTLPNWIYPMIVDHQGDLISRTLHPAFFKKPELPKDLFDKSNCHGGF